MNWNSPVNKVRWFSSIRSANQRGKSIDVVKKWQGKYFSESNTQIGGPFETLKAAIETLPTGNAIVDATTEVECEEMSDEKLAAYLEVDGAEEGMSDGQSRSLRGAELPTFEK